MHVSKEQSLYRYGILRNLINSAVLPFGIKYFANFEYRILGELNCVQVFMCSCVQGITGLVVEAIMLKKDCTILQKHSLKKMSTRTHEHMNT